MKNKSLSLLWVHVKHNYELQWQRRRLSGEDSAGWWRIDDARQQTRQFFHMAGAFDSTVYSSGLSGIKERGCFAVLRSEMPIDTSRTGGDEGRQVTRFDLSTSISAKRFDRVDWEVLA